MTISPKLYISDSLMSRKKRVLRKIEKNKVVLRLYIITNASHPDNIFEIHYYNETFQKVVRNYYNYTIYGIAKTKDEAYALLEQMTNDCLAQQGNCDLRNFMDVK